MKDWVYRVVYRDTPSLLSEIYQETIGLLRIALTTDHTCATLRGDLVMDGDRRESEVEPVDVANAAGLVGRTLRDIDASNVPEIDALLTDLLCAAWPTERAQSQ